MKVELLKFPTADDWLGVKQRALVTCGLTPTSAPSLDWKRKILRARHSPIRFLTFSFYISDLPYWVSVELCRHHVGCEKFVKSQRNDRQSEYDRNAARQDAPVNMIFDCNAESLMILANKRLCNKASAEMRSLLKEMCEQVIHTNPEFFGLLVPFCQAQGGFCNEMEPCKK